jgi:cytochrome b
VVVLIAGAWWTAEHDQMQLHRTIGYVIAGLLVFRLWWGVAGSSTARFASFVKGPATVARYARSLIRGRSESDGLGHNPMGGWSVVALLSVLAAEVALGLFSVDVDGLESGPFADRLSFDEGRVAAHWHHWLFNGLLVLICLHLLAIGLYAVRRENLIGPMLTGHKAAVRASDFKPAPWWRLLAGAILAFVVATALARGLKI